VIHGTTTISAHLGDPIALEFFGFGAITSEKLRAVAALT
jgi:hypothetical protein